MSLPIPSADIPSAKIVIHKDKIEIIAHIITSAGVIFALWLNLQQMRDNKSDEKIRVSQNLCQNFLSSETLVQAQGTVYRFGPFLLGSDGKKPKDLIGKTSLLNYEDKWQELQVSFAKLVNYMNSAVSLVNNKIADENIFDSCLAGFSYMYYKIMKKHGKTKAAGVCDKDYLSCSPESAPELSKYISRKRLEQVETISRLTDNFRKHRENPIKHTSTVN